MSSPVLDRNLTAHSAELRKVLGLRDLVLAQILIIVGLGWVGEAAKLGPPHVVFWLLAVVLFYLPSGAVVIYLNRLMPLEGGLYQWAKLGFNEFTGFLVAWNLWFFSVALFAVSGLEAATVLSYSLGPRAAWLAESKWAMATASVVIIGFLVIVAIVGLSLGKWLQDAGGMFILFLFLVLITLPFRNLINGTLPAYHPLAIVRPPVSWLSLAILGRMGFGAMGGFEYVAIFAGESHNARRSIGLSVLIAAPIVAAMFILGTSAVLAFVPPGQVNLVSPISQALTAGAHSGEFGARLIPYVLLGGLGLATAQKCAIFAGTSRLPLVAGWDHLLPAWFARLHSTRKTPANSILFVAAMSLALGLATVAGAGSQEAQQTLEGVGGSSYALAYLVLFALPLLGFRGIGQKAPPWLKAAAASGFLMTVLYVVMAAYPILDVPHPLLFSIKVSGTLLASNLVGVSIFLGYQRRTRPARDR